MFNDVLLTYERSEKMKAHNEMYTYNSGLPFSSIRQRMGKHMKYSGWNVGQSSSRKHLARDHV